jgi:putative glutamine amidotransferase
VIAAGGLPVHLPIEADPVALAAHLDGVLLTGGADLSPDLYGAESETDLFPPEVDRDAFELALVDEALDRDLPVLGICRGLQLLNVHAGGSLHQHVPEHSRFDISPSSRVHDVVFEPGSRLGELYGERARVNTLHHQTVDRVGAAFTVTARADDGTVEGLEVPGADVVAVQWHPEMLTDPEPVFTWLVDAARAHAT